MEKTNFFLPKSKYTKETNPDYSYNQKSYVGGFRNDCSGFVSNVLRTNGYAVPMDFTTTNIKNWANKSNPYFEMVGTLYKYMICDECRAFDCITIIVRVICSHRKIT